MRSTLITVLVLAAPVPAQAAESVYFHLAGVSRETYTADLKECAELAAGARAANVYVYSPNPYAAAVGAFFGALMEGAEERRMERSIQRTCMADKGYSRMKVDRKVWREIAKLDAEARLGQLYEMAASAEPVGERLPR
jgi:hypothetical protein